MSSQITLLIVCTTTDNGDLQSFIIILTSNMTLPYYESGKFTKSMAVWDFLNLSLAWEYRVVFGVEVDKRQCLDYKVGEL